MLYCRTAVLPPPSQGLDARIPAHDPTVNASNWMLDISTITMERKLGLDFADAYAGGWCGSYVFLGAQWHGSHNVLHVVLSRAHEVWLKCLCGKSA